jgi:O-antigen/teichoic acid export membrane protein
MLIYWPSRVGLATLQGLERYDQTAWIQIISALCTLVTLAILAMDHSSVVLLTAAFGLFATCEGLAAAALAARPLGVNRSWIEGRWLRDEQIRTVMSFGGAAFLIGLSTTLLTGFDRAIVGGIVGAGAIVGYDLAQRPQSAVQTLSTLPGLALISPVARLHAHGQLPRARVLVLVASFASVVVGAPLGVLVIALSHPFVIAWVGRRFAADAWLLDVFVSFWVFNSMTSALSAALYGIGRIKTYARITIVTAVVSLPLSIGLVYAWGTVGVIWGTVIPAGIALPIFVRLSLKLLEIPLRDFARDVLLPGYGLLIPWGAAVFAGRMLLQPSGYPGLIAFSAVALALWCLLTGPILLRRIRLARTATP